MQTIVQPHGGRLLCESWKQQMDYTYLKRVDWMDTCWHTAYKNIFFNIFFSVQKHLLTKSPQSF